MRRRPQLPRAVVTGAAGFIGSHLTDALLATGHRVVGIDAFTPYYSPAAKRANIAAACLDPNFDLLPADLNELHLDEVLRADDLVFHLAAQPGVAASWGDTFGEYSRNNIEASQRLLEACKRQRVKRVVYASSSSVYGDAPLPMVEDGPLQPVSPYGVTKRTAEELCLVYSRSFGLPVVPLRFFTVYGPRQRPDMAFNRFIRAIVEGTPVTVHGDGTQMRDFTFVGDVVAVLIAAMARAEPGQPINVGGGSTISVLETVAILEGLLGRRAVLEYRRSPPGDARDTQAETHRLRRLHDQPLMAVAEGLEKQVAWQIPAMGRLRRTPAVVAEPGANGDAPRSVSKTVLMYSHDTYGMGHLRRNTAIAHALVMRDPATRVVLLSGSSVALEWPLPEGVSVVRLPAVVKVGAETYEPVDARSMSGLRAERAGIINSTLMRLRPDVFLVDHAPLGMKRELSLALEMAREELPDTRVVLGSRDILDDAASVRRLWKEQGIYEILESSYDQVLVYGCRALYDTVAEYGIPSAVAERVVFTGYVGKDPGLEPDLESGPWSSRRRGDRKRILVMGGGGADARDLFRLFMRAWRRLSPRASGEVLMVMGPLMAGRTLRSIEARAQRLNGLQVMRSSKNILSLVSAADVVVSMGGYNSVVEALSARKPLVICPRITPRTEQLIRAEILARVGLARLVRSDQDGPRELAATLSEALENHRPSEAAWKAIDLDGASRIAACLLTEDVPDRAYEAAL